MHRTQANLSNAQQVCTSVTDDNSVMRVCVITIQASTTDNGRFACMLSTLIRFKNIGYTVHRYRHLTFYWTVLLFNVRENPRWDGLMARFADELKCTENLNMHEKLAFPRTLAVIWHLNSAINIFSDITYHNMFKEINLLRQPRD